MNEENHKSEELQDSELDNVAGGARRHAGTPTPDMGDVEPDAPGPDPMGPEGPIQEEEQTGLPDDSREGEAGV